MSNFNCMAPSISQFQNNKNIRNASIVTISPPNPSTGYGGLYRVTYQALMNGTWHDISIEMGGHCLNATPSTLTYTIQNKIVDGKVVYYCQSGHAPVGQDVYGSLGECQAQADKLNNPVTASPTTTVTTVPTASTVKTTIATTTLSTSSKKPVVVIVVPK